MGIGMRNLDNSSGKKAERKISKSPSENSEKLIFLEEKIKKSEQKISMLENQRFSDKKEIDETKSANKSLEDQLAIKLGDLLDKDNKISSMIETLQDFESRLNEEESQRQRHLIRIQHFEEDEKIMKGRIDQLRSDYRQQEKVKKEIVDQLKFAEQKNEADYE